MRINIGLYCLCFLSFLNCKPADLCNPADLTSRCGILQLAMQKPNSSNPLSNPHCSPCKMFVTATTYNANLGGIIGADNKCSLDANKPPSGIYKALIVNDTNRNHVR